MANIRAYAGVVFVTLWPIQAGYILILVGLIMAGTAVKDAVKHRKHIEVGGNIQYTNLPSCECPDCRKFKSEGGVVEPYRERKFRANPAGILGR